MEGLVNPEQKPDTILFIITNTKLFAQGSNNHDIIIGMHVSIIESFRPSVSITTPENRLPSGSNNTLKLAEIEYYT